MMDSIMNTPRVDRGIPPFMVSEEFSVQPMDVGQAQVFEHYQQTLESSPYCMAYLENLGISMELAQTHGLGYSARTLGDHIPSGRMPEGAAIRGSLQYTGLIKPSGSELFRGALVVPFKDASGHIAAAYGRRIAPRINKGTGREVFWVTPELFDVPLFCPGGELDQGIILLCQSPLDALMLLSAGYSNVVATLGLNGFSNGHLEQLASLGIRRVVCLFENTNAGSHYARLVAQCLDAEGIRCSRSLPPEGSDLAEQLQSSGTSCLSELLSHARPCKQTYEYLQEAMDV